MFSFVERVKETTIEKKQVFNIDMNKSRKNAIYCSEHDFPLSTVMDEVEAFKPFASSYDKPRLYYVETDQYSPMRGNGWCSHAMGKSCVDNLLINQSDMSSIAP